MPEDTGLTPISLRVPPDVLEKLDRVATAIDRPRSWVCLRAIRVFLAEEGAEILDIQAGAAEADRGEIVDAEDVLAEIDKIIATAEPANTAG